jgi:NADH dehydrogenase FAD-containing subunit
METAAELAEAGRAVTLVCGGPLGPYLHPRGRRVVERRLAALGIRVLTGPGTVVTSVTADGVRLQDGSRIEGVTAWAAGFRAPDLAARSGLSTDAVGRLITDETLTAIGDDRIVAAGDVASPSGLPYRMGCQSAVQLGPQAAETVLARIDGRPPKPVDVAFAGQCISLGRRTAIFQFARRDDRPVPLTLRGPVAAGLKELICRGTAWQLGFEARRPGLIDGWLPDGSRADRLIRAAAPERVEA